VLQRKKRVRDAIAGSWFRPGRNLPRRNQLRLVFLFFSSRLGCLGSLAVSALLTLLLLWMFDVI
jgi:hypothetical protein